MDLALTSGAIAAAVTTRVGDLLDLLSYLGGRLREDIAQRHWEHPPGHELKGGRRSECFRNGPVERFGGSIRSVDADDYSSDSG